MSRSAPLSGRSWTIGAAADNDIVVEGDSVSGHHCRLTEEGPGYVLEDLGSTNGTFVNGKRLEPASPVAVSSSDHVSLGRSVPFPWAEIPRKAPTARAAPTERAATRFMSEQPSPQGALPNTLSLRGESMVLGRDPQADHVLDDPMVSWRHARLTRTAASTFVQDLGSTNGTFVNGRRITSRVAVKPGDVIGLARFTFQLTTAFDLEKRDDRGNVTIEVRDLGVTVGGGKKLVAGISFTVHPSELVGLMGPSGAGKTTVLRALNGYRAPSTGSVLFNGQDLYSHYDAFRLQLGYVPQDDIMHRELTVGEALYYSARLRLPRDFSDAELRARIRTVTSDLEIQHVEDTRIGSAGAGISGGQRKRVALAMELLTDPSVLFLDEPTSGLSSEDALLVMKLLRKLADSGKTIVLVLHQPSLEIFQLMDNLAVVSKDAGKAEAGRLVYYGRAWPDSVDFFSPEPGEQGRSPDAVLRGLKTKRTAEWTRAYAASAHFREYVHERRGRTPSPARAAARAKTRKGGGAQQWWTLVRRTAAVKWNDTANTAILVAQAPVIGALIVMVFGNELSRPLDDVVPVAEWAAYAGALATTTFLLAATAIWFGCSNAAREIVAEWPIYQRERMVTLGVPSYVLSKLAVLGAVSAMQCVVLLGLVYAGASFQGSLPGMLVVLLLASFVGLAIGLAISAVARSSEVAITVVPLVLLPMVILAGSMQPVHKMSSGGRALSTLVASRWAFEGLLLREAPSRPRVVPAPCGLPAPCGADPAAHAGVTAAKRPEPDFAEDFFPRDRRRRGWPDRPLVVLALMLAAMVAGVMGILTARDIH
jgi:ABC-type multidrug transport system ATPase subunit/pSer/pThr/pTyr-binding forkhead associated (FHA) protein